MTGDSLKSLRLINWIVSLGIPVTLYLYVRRRIEGPWVSSLLLFPLVSSSFVVKSGVWVFTDNAALLLGTLAILAMLSGRTSLGFSFLIGGLSGLAVFARQLYAWLSLPIIVRAVVISCSELKLRHRLMMVAGVSIPTLVVLKLYLAWGGFVPPAWREASLKVSLCPVAYILANFALFGLLFMPFEGLSQMRRLVLRRSSAAAVVLGLLAAVVSPTSFNHAEGRWGGYLWWIADLFPVIEDRSVFFLAAAPVGALVISLIWSMMRSVQLRGESTLWLSCVVAWAGSFVLNRQVFQRYFEPTIIVLLVLAVVQIHERTATVPNKGHVSRLIVLTLFQLLVTSATVFWSIFGKGV